jgi:gluconokinase
VMFAAPLRIVGDAEGTAPGAAALGLFGIGRAASPADGVAALSEPGAEAQPVECTPEPVVTYQRLGETVSRLIGALDAVAGQFDPERRANLSERT